MNKSNNEKRPGLKVFEKFTPEGENLRPGYAYLIRSSVRMPELYPFLGELLFASRVVRNDEKQEQGVEVPPNIIGMFIEDSPDNLIQHLKGPDFYPSGSDITGKFGNALVMDKEPRMAAWLDTFGKFYDAGGDLEAKKFMVKSGELEEKYNWWRKSVAGPGNPMAIMRFFRLVQKKQGEADLNVFLLNSLSNLYRNLGLSESAAFLKTMLSESIWSVETNQRKLDIGAKSSLFFAVLQEDVLDEHGASYLESFFDGIVKVKPCELNGLRVARVHVEVLPELIKSQHDKDFVYLSDWQCQDKNNECGDGWRKEVYIWTQAADMCKDFEADNDEGKKKSS